jgi:hypothetical protein
MITTFLIVGAGVFLVLLMVSVIVMMEYQRAIRCTINYPTATGKPLEEHIRMRPKLDKETGIVYWRGFFDSKIKFPEPPAECITHVKNKGIRCISVTRVSEDEFVYDHKKYDDKKLSTIVEPYTAVDRQIVVEQHIKATKKRQSNWLLQNVLPLGAMLILAVVVVMGMAFWGDIVAPIEESRAVERQWIGQIMQYQNALIANGVIISEEGVVSGSINVSSG